MSTINAGQMMITQPYMGLQASKAYSISEKESSDCQALADSVTLNSSTGAQKKMMNISLQGAASLLGSSGSKAGPLWSFRMKDESNGSPVVAPDGTVYAALEDGTVTAVKNGTELWSCKTPKSITTSPALAPDGTLYVGSEDGKVYALKNGKKIKEFALKDGWIYSDPVVAPDGTVYVGSDTGKLYAIRNGSMQCIRKTETEKVRCSVNTAPDGTAYASAFDRLYVMKDGKVKEEIRFNDSITTSPVSGPDGTLYIGSFSGNLYAIRSGKVQWAFQTGGIVSAPPVITSDDTVYVKGGGRDGNPQKLHVLKDGQKIWDFNTKGDERGAPAVTSGGVAYVVNENGKFCAVKDGAMVRQYDLDIVGGYGMGRSPAVGTDGTVYVFGEKNLYAIENSMKVLEELQQDDLPDDLQPAGEKPSIEASDEWIIIGGTKLPVKK
ncbi:MAG: PQQ-binding-like beta-propeller repeat protein [Candidatus Xenobiia bacterium LiM19]